MRVSRSEMRAVGAGPTVGERLRLAATLARCPLSVLYRFEGAEAVLHAAHGPAELVDALPASAARWRLDHERPRIVPVIGRGPAAPEGALFAPRLGVRALASSPVRRAGHTLGALLFADVEAREDLESFDPMLFYTMAELLEDVLPNPEPIAPDFGVDSLPPGISDEMEWPLLGGGHDAATGLPDRRMVLDSIRSVLDSRQAVTMAIIALDRFQRIDDWLGRAVSDELLRQVAERLLEATEEDDVVGRGSGDGFLVALTSVPAGRSPQAHVHRILAAFREPFHVHGYELGITASVGVARGPEDTDDAATLLRYAQIALHRAKRARQRGRVETFTPALREAVEQRGDLERHLRHAITDGGLLLHYQPKVDLGTRRATSVEALIRWRRGDRLVSPGEFLPLAEESELIVPIGRWVMEESVRQMRYWRDRGVPLDSVAVNVSALQFARPGFVGGVERLLERSTLPPGCLELEVTETSLMDDVASAATKLTSLRKLGVKVSVDDFGTGYSSLSYLQQLPVDVLKIDRAFIKDLDVGGTPERHAHALTQAITGLGHSLGLEVLAEGVETVAQLDALAALGCDSVQGYYFSRPLPALDIEAYVGQGVLSGPVPAATAPS